jgi:hypothetical protein
MLNPIFGEHCASIVPVMWQIERLQLQKSLQVL